MRNCYFGANALCLCWRMMHENVLISTWPDKRSEGVMLGTRELVQQLAKESCFIKKGG